MMGLVGAKENLKKFGLLDRGRKGQSQNSVGYAIDKNAYRARLLLTKPNDEYDQVFGRYNKPVSDCIRL